MIHEKQLFFLEREMPFHLLPPPPPPHVMHMMLAAGLAVTVGAFFITRRRVADSVGAFTSRLGGRWPLSRRTGETYGVVAAHENLAFSEYRDQTLKTLEDEAVQFRRFLDGLRRAADVKDFEAFLSERRTARSGALPAPQN